MFKIKITKKSNVTNLNPAANRMGIGSRIALTRAYEGIGPDRKFPVGHEFTITGDSGQRGWDIEDDAGKKIAECGMMQDTFRLIK